MWSSRGSSAHGARDNFPARGPTQQNPHPSNPDMVNGSVQRSTVGVVPTPADTSAAALLTCLESLRKQACGRLRWIAAPSECSALATTIAQAADEVDGGNPQAAARELDALLADLDAAFASGRMSDAGYWLLASNVRIIRGKL